MNILQNAIPPHLPDNTYVAMDTEWYGMILSRIHRPHTGKFACLTVCYRPGEVHLIMDPDLVWRVLERVENCVWVFHNAKFDLTHLRRLASIPPRAKVIDTMMMDRILWNGYYEQFGLGDLSRRYLGVHLDKSLQEKWQTMTEMTPEAIEYSVLDAEVTLRVWTEQKKYITRKDMQVYQTIDLPAMWAVMDFRGFALDKEGWRSLAEDNKAHAKRLEEENLDFNPRSWKQVVAKLSQRGFKGMKNSKEEELERLMRKYPETEAAKQAAIILECREFSHFASTYGKRWLEDYLECFPDGSWGFVCDYWIIGAETGRMCVAGDTLLDTTIGTYRIDSLPLISSIPCAILTHRNLYKRILKQIYKGEEEMFAVTLDNGSSIKCTAQHQFLTPQGWRKLHDLTNGDQLLTLDPSDQWPMVSAKRKNLLGSLYGHRQDADRDQEGTQYPTPYLADHLEILPDAIPGAGDCQGAKDAPAGVSRTGNTPQAGANLHGQGSAGVCDRIGDDRMGHHSNLQSGHPRGAQEHPQVQTGSTVQTAQRFDRPGVGRNRKNGSTLARIARKCLHFALRPGKFLSSLIRCVRGDQSVLLGDRKTGGAVRLLPGEEQSPPRSHLLETEQTRNLAVRKIALSGGRAYSRTSMGAGSGEDVLRRFLLPTSQLDRGSERINPQERTDPGARPTEIHDSPTTRGQAVNLHFYPGAEGDGWRATNYSIHTIYGITPVGIEKVWDIEVEGDHSYVANGFINHNSARNPPLQQVPSRSTKVFREKFIARPGCKLIICDYSQQEFFIMAYVTGDKKMIALCNSGKDVYIMMAKLMYGVDIDKKDPLRARMKSVVLGIDYGMSEYGLAKREGITEKEAAEVIFKFLQTFPGADDYMRRMRRERKIVHTVAGRKYHLNPYSSQVERNALNSPVQGTAADMFKRATGEIHQGWEWACEFGIVNEVHDEIILDVPEELAPEIAKFVQDTMVRVANEMCPGLHFKADAIIANNWAEKG